MSKGAIFGVERTFARPLISAAAGAATFGTFFPDGAIIFNDSVPDFVKGVMGPGMGPFAAGAVMGALSSFVCENVSTALDIAHVKHAPGISLAQCFAASALTFVLVPTLINTPLNGSSVPTSAEIARLVAAGVLTEMSSRWIFQTLFSVPSDGASVGYL